MGKTISVRILLALVFGLFSLPLLGFGGWLLYVWIAVHLRQQTYLDYPYLYVGVTALVLGSLSLSSALYGAWRRAYWGILFVMPNLTGLWAMIVIPNIVPFDIATGNHVGQLERSLYLYQEERGRFPGNEAELRQTAASVLEEPSNFLNRGKRLNFRLVVLPGASGPWISTPGDMPGIVFYSVAPDRLTCWLTVTDLDKGRHVQFKRINFYNGNDPIVLELTPR